MNIKQNGMWCIAAVLTAAIVVSCGEKEPEQPPPPPPPSPEQIKQAANSLVKSISDMKPGESMRKYGQRCASAYSQFKQTYGDTETGQQLIRGFISRLSSSLDSAVDAGNWELASVFCDALQALDPSNFKAKMARKKIDRELSKPKVSLVGFYKDRTTNELTVMFSVILPQNKNGPELSVKERTKSVNVKVGEEFYGYKLKRVIENQQATITYLEDRTNYNLLLRKSE
ncbi:MAG: hypothetical protein J7M12_00430 [Candidatus Hydrogenedentes bacterium]|nr:hypothetical protein [Candidatus Hydrogenedentota bacterium]